METKFNFNSQVCTDKIQSERLLSLGLKKETADCYWFYCDIAKEWKCTILSSNQVFKDYPTTVIPAWSLHRLWELSIINKVMLDSVDEIAVLYDGVIDKIEEQIKIGYFPKEYLEE